SRPFPDTLMRPSSVTTAARSEITHSWPGGWTPRTMLRLTVAAVGAGPGALDTGSTPMPPLNLAIALSALAHSGADASRNSVQAKVFRIMRNSFVGWGRGARDVGKGRRAIALASREQPLGKAIPAKATSCFARRAAVSGRSSEVTNHPAPKAAAIQGVFSRAFARAAARMTRSIEARRGLRSAGSRRYQG